MMAGCSKAFFKSKREIKRIGEKTEREKEEVIFETFIFSFVCLPVDTIRLSLSQSMVAGGEAKTTQRIL